MAEKPEMSSLCLLKMSLGCTKVFVKRSVLDENRYYDVNGQQELNNRSTLKLIPFYLVISEAYVKREST